MHTKRLAKGQGEGPKREIRRTPGGAAVGDVR
jgi:hypothetical protein